MIDEPLEMPPPPPPQIADVLAGIDQDTATALVNAFNGFAHARNTDVATVMWALANLQATVLAKAGDMELQVWTAMRFAEMVEVALGARMLAMPPAIPRLDS